MTDSEIIELLQMQLKTQQQQNEFLQKTIESLNQNIQSQTETIETLTEKIADLEEKLNKNSRNSSKPPSSDGYSKPNPKSLRPKSEKKAGGQKGHKSSNLSVPKKIDRTVSHYPARCEKCPLFEKCKGTVCVPAEKRYTVILRELVGVIENHPHQRWAKMFRDMLHELYRLKKSYADCGRTRLDTCYLDYYSLKYDEIIGIARKENPPPLQTEIKRGRKKKGKVLALIERLAQLKDSMLLFARNFEVPFTNNAAERTIRNLKSKSKVAGNFRSDDGARWYLKIRSYIDSARKHGVNAFEAVKLAFAGTPALCLGF